MPETGSPVVLVADGEAGVLESVSGTLEKAGFTVFTALGGPELTKLCERHREPVQLAIVDLTMPGQGPELLDQLYRAYPGIRILFTGNVDESKTIRQIGRSGQVREFLKKPFRRSQLLGRVLQVMDAPMVSTA